MTNLKDYRDKELPMFIIANVLLFLIVHKILYLDTTDISETAQVLSEVVESMVFSVIAFGFILVTECLFTSDFKAKLLYIFGLLSAPGNTIFTKIKDKNPDIRFSYQAVNAKYTKLYIEMPKDQKARFRYENEYWYSIYNQCRDASMIHHSQRDWLLCRDIYISALLLTIMYAIVVALNFISFNKLYFLFLVAMLVITNIGANRKAVRFAFNVIAYDLTKPQEKKGK